MFSNCDILAAMNRNIFMFVSSAELARQLQQEEETQAAAQSATTTERGTSAASQTSRAASQTPPPKKRDFVSLYHFCFGKHLYMFLFWITRNS